MREILAGGVLVTRDALVYARRRRVPQLRPTARPGTKPMINRCVQPGQLVSPLLKFGFPSLAVH